MAAQRLKGAETRRQDADATSGSERHTPGMERQTASSGSPWEGKFGYRRAVRIGQSVQVSGTLPIDADGNTFAPGDAYAQARWAFEIALKAASELGASIEHVIRTRMFVTDIRFAEDFGRAHGELFGDHPPASTLVEVRKLVLPDALIEVEVEALLP
jgi:isochorismate pyruvate lyase